jgi:1-deoxy-D-xylulose-5-phosphate reductoisomerase
VLDTLRKTLVSPPESVVSSQQNVCILGATGSIGDSTLKVLALHPERYRVFGLSGHSRLDQLV